MRPPPRRLYSAEQKLYALRRHLIDKVPVSALCEELELQPSVFYSWQQQLFERGVAAFEGAKLGSSREKHQDQKIAELEMKLAGRDAVIAKKDSVIAGRVKISVSRADS
jgi:transposase-like protein